MSSIQTLELRQLDSQNVYANGDYEIQLAKAITVNDGDVVQLKNAFIDTVKESQIVLLDDLTLVIKNGVYYTGWYRDPGIIAKSVDSDGNPYTDTPDFRRYIPYIGSPGGAGSFYGIYVALYLRTAVTKSFDAFPVTFSYQNSLGNIAYITVTIPAVKSGTFNYLTIPFNIIAYLPLGVNPVSTTYADLEAIGVNFNNWIITNTTEVIYEPFYMTTEITIPKASYSPTEMATLISQQLSQSGLQSKTSNSQNMEQSKFLFALGDFDIGVASPDGRLNPNGTPVLLTEQTKFISDDGLALLEFTPGSVKYIGSSQMGLEFNPDSQKFQWTQIHSNMLDSTSGTDIAVRFLRYNFSPEGKVNGIANNGGVFFNSLTAFDSKGKYVPFWDGVLGFNLTTLCVNSTYNANNLFGDINVKYNLLQPLSIGVNITDGYYGLDSAIIRGTPADSVNPPDYSKPYSWIGRVGVPFYDSNVPGTTLDIAQAGISSTINSTVAIIAPAPIDLLLNKFSHYILQTDLGFSNNDYIGIDYYKNINGIISKYYSFGSYCASLESEGALQYIHRGNTIQLKSIKIRLLTSSKTLDVNLGQDNTVIFQIIKSPPVVDDNKSTKG